MAIVAPGQTVMGKVVMDEGPVQVQMGTDAFFLTDLPVWFLVGRDGV